MSIGDDNLIARLGDTLGLVPTIAATVVRVVREHDAAAAARSGDPAVAVAMARALARQAETIAAQGDQILELSKK